jgi:ribosomal protein S18 acetylase RimI-like enzyme
VRRGACQRSIAHPFGEAFFDDGLPRVWILNELSVDADDVDADALVCALDQLYAHLPHRRAFVEHPEVGERLAPSLRQRGWLVERDVFMTLGDGGDYRAVPGLAREADEAAMRAVEAETIGEEPYGRPEVVEQLLAARSRYGSAGRGRYFVGTADGVDAAHATLYSDGAIAQIEDVGTLRAYRRRGLARAVCVAAIEAALAAGHELIFIVADDDDWPKDLYARLGFRAVGRPWCFTRPGPEHPAHRP